MVEASTPRESQTFTAERRADSRYTIQTGLEYRLILRRKVVQTGSGRLMNMSRGGLLFECDRGVPPRTRIELKVDWPAHAVKIALHVVGQTVRTQGTSTAVKILRSAFRVQEDAY